MHHPNSIRPDHSVGFFVPTGPSFALESDDVAKRMATVILRQANEGQATEISHFREAEETRELTNDVIAANIGHARELADRKVIRQDDESYRKPTEAGDVYGIPEASDFFFAKTDDELLTLAEQSCAQIVTDDAIVDRLRSEGFTVSSIARIWPRLTERLGANVASIAKPSIGHIAARAAMANRKAVV